MRMNRSYIESGKGMDSVMNYILIDSLIRYFKYSDIETIRRVLNELIYEYPTDTLNSLMNFTSTHDISRAINIFSSYEFSSNREWVWDLNDDRNWQKNYKLSKGQYEKGKKIYKSYIFTLAFLPGNLSIFYGDEIGLEGMGNLSNRKSFPKKIKDLELLKFFKYIGNIRKNEKELETADLCIKDINNNYFMFERKSNDTNYIITVNRSDESINISIPTDYEKTYILNKVEENKLESHGGIVLKKRCKHHL